jgi:hypothetical protein
MLRLPSRVRERQRGLGWRFRRPHSPAAGCLGNRPTEAPVVRESAPVYTPVSYAAIGNDKIGEIAQEPVMPPALTCIREKTTGSQ